MPEIPKPPYVYEADHAYSVHIVRTSEIRKHLNPGFNIVGFFGWTLLIVAMIKYEKAASANSQHADFAYDELMFICPVRHRLKLGLTAFRLFLNNNTGILTGKVFYGFPKSYAALKISSGKNRFSMTYGNRVLSSVRILNRCDFLPRILMRMCARMFLRKFSILLIKDGNLVLANFEMSNFSLRIGSRQKADFRPLTEIGKASKPIFTVLLLGSKFKLKRPQTVSKV
ncbi:MAG: hypothetical protein V1648_02790 [Candidatus Aenigmatarchaeota archaeon]